MLYLNGFRANRFGFNNYAVAGKGVARFRSSIHCIIYATSVKNV
jgi:hypothetical protein